MEGSLSVVISNYHCSNFSLHPNLQQRPVSSHLRRAKFQFPCTRKSRSIIHENSGNYFNNPCYIIKLFKAKPRANSQLVLSATQGTLHTPSIAIPLEEEISGNNTGSLPPNDKEEMLPKIDKSGRFCSPRAARELALLTVYAACLEGSDPLRLFDKRLNAPREPGYEFDKASLLQYNHMSFSGPPVTANTLEEADKLLHQSEAESSIEAQVLAAPPKLVYSKLVLRFCRKLLVAVLDRWDKHALVIDRVAPVNWKNEPASRILEFSILHLAMSEISVLGTRHQIVINEAVDLAKRFCDGTAPRIINGCLRTFVNDLEERSGSALGGEQKVVK